MEFARPSNGYSLDRYDTEKISDGPSSLSMNGKTNVHVHNGTAAHNGTTSPVDCWVCTTELAEWKKTVQEITERCDLSGLSTEPTKYQLESTGIHGAVPELEYRSATIPDKVRTGLNMICTRGRLTPESLIMFAVHKMLKAFGNGSHTVTAVFSPRQGGLSWVVVPSVADHRTQDHQTIASALDEASSYLAHSHSKSESVVMPSDLVRGELLDIIVVFDSASEARPPLPCFPLILWVNIQQGDWTLSLQYASRLLSTMVGDSLLGALQALLASTLDPTRLVRQIELLPPKQLAQLNLWNYTDGEYPSDKRLHHLFEEVTLEAGDHVALICGEKQVTYTALNKQANQLAHFILSIGVQPEQLVGLFLDKSETMIAVILGIWKSGAAYTPIDPAYPDDRVRFILDDTQVRTIVASQKHVARLENAILSDRKIRIIPLEPLLETLHQQSSSDATHNLSHLPLTSKQLAYVTYTSGTTGFPKGIYKEHTSVVNSITDLSARYGVSGCDDEVILLFSAYVFEPFVRQMLMALTTGNRLAIISDEDKFDPDTLLPFIRRHKVTYLNGTASVLQEYDLTSCTSLKRMILVGENLTDSRYGALRRRFKARIFNEYGFTESAFVTALKIFEPASERKDMSLGRPVRNVKCYILDANLRRVPLGVTGELHIGGMGISRGYMNRDDLTRTKFLKNPYQTESEAQRGVNGLMYKTGDLARWLPSGEVEYLGRADFQIKLRGIRIEPGEIESTLATFPGIRTSIVVSKKLLRQGQETREDLLVGYFVCDEATLPENDILAFLEHKLPRYMIPARLVQLKQIPVTINGKADLRALPIVNVAVPAVDSIPTHRDDFADKLADIWADVLQVPSNTIALDQSFFRLGGHSITCIQLIARVRQHLGRAISLEQVFQAKTLSAMADLLRTQPPSSFGKESNDAEFGHNPRTTNKSDGGTCLANSLQQGFVYHSLKTLQSEAYIMQSTLHYQLPLSMEKYRDAWASVQRRHPALRLRFAWENEVTQIVDEKLIFDWRILDWSTITETQERGSLMHDLYQADRSEGFNLGKGPLMRLYFVQLAQGEAFCLFSCHHSILDGWSQPILFEQVHEAYLKLVDGKPLATETDQSYMQCQLYLQHHRQDHLDFWSKKLAQVDERCDMSSLLNESARYKVPLADYDRIKEQRQQTVQLAWHESTMKQLQAECLNEGLTIHSVLQLVWHLVLHSYGGGTTITGTTISGRHLPIVGIEQSIGMFINTLPLVFDHGSCRDMTALEAMSHVQDQVNAMNSRGNVELGRLRKDDLKHGLFDSLFVLENYPSLDTSQRIAHQKRLRCHIEGGMETLSYPLAVIAREHGTDGCSFTLCYAGELFTDETIEALLHTVRDAFAQITQNIHVLLRDLEYLSVGQKEQLAEWNSNEGEFPNATLHAIFESEAQQHPNKVAVVYEDVQLTYRELNSRANALAHHLLSNVSIQPNNLVALVMEKSEHMITSIFAVWKTGGAYVPIDPNYPEHRIKYILQDTCALAVITDQAYMGRIEGIVEGEIPVVPSDEALRLPPSPVHPASSCLASDLAYVMYTSGTTGLPKGVMVEHHGVVNLAVSLSHIFGLRDTDDEVILSFSNYVFDHFVEQMTDALLNGQTLVVLNDEMRGDKERLYRYIEQNKVTYLSGTPSVISMYEFDRFRSHMRRIDCVGEAFSEPVFDKIRETFPGLVINGYGPTEVSITTSKRLYQFPERRTNKSIGSQISNSTSYVLNADMKRVPIGAVGELFLGGDGVARGYHNRPELTAERFPRNPFQTEEERRQGRNARLYKTGDLVRWIPDSAGEVEYLGRNDFQVKIRGQRIELGEIEAILSSYAGIDQSIVLAKDRETDGQKYLVGYYVSSSTTLNTQAIRSYMKMRLPDYMVPSRLIPTKEFPVTVSGKLDTKALPLPAEAADEEVVPPRTDTERALARIWAEVLDVPLEIIGVYSDFFGLGGDSLKSTRLSFAASKALGVAVSVGSLFSHPTIEGLSRWIETDAGKLEEVETHLHGMQSEFPLSPAQQRLLFMHELGGDGDGSAYNISWHVKLLPSVSLEALDKALRNVLERHEALRTLIKGDGDEFEYFQKIVDNAAAQKMFKIRVLEVDSESQMRHKMTEADNHSFNLDFALPFLVCVYHLSENGQQSIYASFVFHHIAFDAWSWGLFTKDLNSFYSVHMNQQAQPELSSLRVQYKEYSIEHRKTLDSDQRQVLSAYWLKKLSDFEPLHLITDHPRPSQFNYAGSDLKFSLEKKHHDKLRCLARDQGTSLYTVVASAFVLLMSVYTGQQDVVIGVPVSHRARAEFESVVGFFVNLLPLRVQIYQTDIRGLIHTVQKELVNVQSHQDLPFQDIAKLLYADHDLSRHPISQVVFNWETVSEESDAGVLGDKYQPSDALPSVAKFDLHVTIQEGSSSLGINFNYATNLFKEKTVRGFMNTFQHILEQFVNDPSISLRDLSYASKQQGPSHSISSISNLTHSATRKSLCHIFEEYVSITPESVAVTDGIQKISYHDINIRANQVAHYISPRVKISHGDRIGLVLDKSINMIVSILAAWKLGAAYVPLDPSYPAQRIKYILEATEAKAVLTTSTHSLVVVKTTSVPSVLLDGPEMENVLQQSKENIPTQAPEPSSPAYVIFTSGTTGKPKGVVVEHQSIAILRDALVKRYFDDKHGPQAILFLSNYVFDFSLEQFCLSILSGNKLIIPPEEGLTHKAFYTLANNERLTYMSGTPSVLQQIEISRLQHLEMLTVAGEEFHERQYESLRLQFKGQINNAYGITETTVYNVVTSFKYRDPFTKMLINPLPGTYTYVLDSNLQPVPENAVGELYIGGECLSRGYLGQDDLTKEKFIPNPFTVKSNNLRQRLYKTGDIVQFLGLDGIRFIGRRDLQVKLRGLRIELSEIRDAVLAIPEVKAAIVVPRHAKDRFNSGNVSALDCFYTVLDGHECTPTNIRATLSLALPQFMVPSRIYLLPGSLPVTINGKIDVRRLSELTDRSESDTRAHTKPSGRPRNPLEVNLCDLWASLLNMTQCGIDDDLFALGGDSMSSLRLVGEIYRKLGRNITVKDIFIHRTVRALCDHVISSHKTNNIMPAKADQGLVEGVAPLLPIQEWFLSKQLNNPSFWNHCFTIRTSELVLSRLAEALQRLHERHDVFGMRLAEVEGKVVQEFSRSSMPVKLKVLDIKKTKTAKELEETLTRLQSQLNVYQGPVYTVVYIHGYQDGSARIWFALHHLIVDTLSWSIITSDLKTLYQGDSLGLKSSSVRQWALAMKEYEIPSSEKAYWDKTRERVLRNSHLIPPPVGSTLKCEETLTTAKTTAVYQEICARLGVGVHDILLMAVAAALQKSIDGGATIITVEGHGREDSVDPSLDASRTVGWFTTMYPLELPKVKDVVQGVLSVKDAVAKVPNNGVGYGPAYGYTQGTLPSVSVNYLGRLDQAQQGVDGWNIEVRDDGLPQGLCRSPEDAMSNLSMVDVTFFTSGGQLTTQLSCAWGSDAAHDFIHTIRQKIEELIETTADPMFILPPPQTNGGMPFDPYYHFKDGSRQGSPVFLLPPGEGGAESYFHNIVSGLSDRNLVAFNNYYRHSKDLQTIEELAQYYLSHIKSIQPQGPYDLLGWSFGGILALEIAQRLASQGHRIGTLSLIDPYFDVPGAAKAIGQDQGSILDPIYDVYQPDTKYFQVVESSTDHIILFKASRSDDEHGTPLQRRLYGWYAASPKNNLDKYISPEAIQVVPLDGTHFTWVRYSEQVRSMCKLLE